MDLAKRRLIDLSLGAFLLTLLCLHGSQGASIRRHHRQRDEIDARKAHYYEPCGSRTTAAPLDALLADVIVEDPLEEHLDILSKEAGIAKTYVGTLMRKYLTERLKESTHDDLKDFRLEGLPTVPAATYDILIQHGGFDHTQRSLQATYERLVTMDMFIHIIKLEENLHHGSLGYGPQLEGISQSHIFSILCRIRVAMSQHNMDYDNSHIRSVIKHEVRDVSNAAVRYISDYIILRHLKEILNFMELEFEALREHIGKNGST